MGHVLISMLTAACAVLLQIPAAALAQETGLGGALELSGTMFFGSVDEQLFAGLFQLHHTGDRLRVKSELRTAYSERMSEEGENVVSARNNFGSLAVDLYPQHRYSPFAFASAESNLQLRLRNRLNTGVGTKLTTFHRKKDDVSVSLALLWDHTSPLPIDGEPQPSSSLTRWSARLRTNLTLRPGLRFMHVTFVQPVVHDLRTYTANSNVALLFDLTEKLALSTRLLYLYDSEARARGATSNSDGQLVFGVYAYFQRDSK
jgi:hypothetical protein